MLINSKIKAIYINANNILKYGLSAPRYSELIYVNPLDIDRLIKWNTYKSFLKKRIKNTNIVDGDWYKETKYYNVNKYCYKRYVEKIPWEKTGAYDYMIKLIKRDGSCDGCENYDDIIKRYEKIDILYSKIKEDKKLLTQEEIYKKKRILNRGKNEIKVLIDNQGKIILGWGGFHRFSIAKILKIRSIPAMIEVIHPEGIKYINNYRK